MKEYYIKHSYNSQYINILSTNKIRILAKSLKSKIINMKIAYCDTYNYPLLDKINIFEMKKVGCGEEYDYWEANISIEYRRVRYSFIAEDCNSVAILGEKVFKKFNKFDFDDKFIKEYKWEFFTVPFVHYDQILELKQLENTIWYTVFIDRFFNDKRPLKDVNLKSDFEYAGGNIRGIIRKLDYLKDFNVDYLYLMPIMEGLSNHKYDITNYKKIDCNFGSKADLKKLSDECHKKNIKLILDLPINHCSYKNNWFEDVVNNGKSSKYKDWFYVNDYELLSQLKDIDLYEKKINPLKLPYIMFSFVPYLPKLNLSNSELASELIDIIIYWTREFNIDGWRLDAANELPHSFIEILKKRLLDINKNIVLIGEIWGDARPWLSKYQLDTVTNYVLLKYIEEYFIDDKLSTKEFCEKTTDHIFKYDIENSKTMLNLLESQDTRRIINKANNRMNIIKNVYVFLFMFYGNPVIFYGGEVGLRGAMRPLNRENMKWEKNEDSLDVLIKKLAKLRKEYSNFFIDGVFSYINCIENNKVLSYQFSINLSKLVVFINNTSDLLNINMKNYFKDNKIKDIFNGGKLTSENILELDKYDFKIFLVG